MLDIYLMGPTFPSALLLMTPSLKVPVLLFLTTILDMTLKPSGLKRNFTAGCPSWCKPFSTSKIGNWVLFQRHHLTRPKIVNQCFTQHCQEPRTTTTAKPTNKTEQKTSQMTIRLTRECKVFIQGGKHSPCRHCPISLRSYQWLHRTWTMTLHGHWHWLACERLFETLDICVLLRHVHSHT